MTHPSLTARRPSIDQAMREAFNRDDEDSLVRAAKALCKNAILYPSSVNFAAINTAYALLEEAKKHEPRTAASRQSAA